MKPAAGGSGVADEQQPRVAGGHHALNALVNGIGYALGLVHHHQNVLAVKPLKLVDAHRGKPQRVAILPQLPPGIQQDAAENISSPAVQSVNLPPEDVANLPKGRRRTDNNGRPPGMQKPQDSHRGGKILAQPVPGLDGHPRTARQRAQRLLLLLPQANAQHLGGKPNGIIAKIAQPFRAVDLQGNARYTGGKPNGIVAKITQPFRAVDLQGNARHIGGKPDRVIAEIRPHFRVATLQGGAQHIRGEPDGVIAKIGRRFRASDAVLIVGGLRAVSPGQRQNDPPSGRRRRRRRDCGGCEWQPSPAPAGAPDPARTAAARPASRPRCPPDHCRAHQPAD